MTSLQYPRDRIVHDLYPPDYLKALLDGARVIGMVGASPEPWRPSFGIMRYLQRAGYRVIPVNPTHMGTQLHGEQVVSSLTEADAPVDLVNVFRRSDAIGAVVEDAIRANAPAIWLQLGIRNDEAAQRAEEAGMAVVMNRCISVEHARLNRA
ncbi:MAG TPA: CoA-binding protein [Enterovirga sp.]